MKDIVASLKYGRIFSVYLIIFWFLCSLVGLLLLIFAICYLIWFFDSNWAIFIAGLLLGLLFLITGTGLLLKDFIIKTKIKLWLQDSKEIKAHSKQIDTDYSFSSLLSLHRVCICVNFNYNNKAIKMYSGDKRKRRYDMVFWNYCDRDIKILYSPNYNEVMILKTR